MTNDARSRFTGASIGSGWNKVLWVCGVGSVVVIALTLWVVIQ